MGGRRVRGRPTHGAFFWLRYLWRRHTGVFRYRKSPSALPPDENGRGYSVVNLLVDGRSKGPNVPAPKWDKRFLCPVAALFALGVADAILFGLKILPLNGQHLLYYAGIAMIWLVIGITVSYALVTIGIKFLRSAIALLLKPELAVARQIDAAVARENRLLIRLRTEPTEALLETRTRIDVEIQLRQRRMRNWELVSGGAAVLGLVTKLGPTGFISPHLSETLVLAFLALAFGFALGSFSVSMVIESLYQLSYVLKKASERYRFQ